MPAPLSAKQILEFHDSLSNWGRWGVEDQIGTLNLITSAKRRAAAASVRSGRAVSCARSLATEPAPDNPQPVVHHMIGTASEGWGADYFAMAPHGFSTSHIDALCHVFHDGSLYNGFPVGRVTAHGALELAIHSVADGISTRGVLLDVPRVRGVDYLEFGDPIFVSDLEAAEALGPTRVEPGDVVLVRTGRWIARERLGARPPADGLAGLDASCLPWLYERGAAALGSDGVSDVIPSRVEGVALPIHTVAIVAMGLHLLDNLDLDGLAKACLEEERIDCLLTVAPLILYRGTASPVNPIALL